MACSVNVGENTKMTSSENDEFCIVTVKSSLQDKLKQVPSLPSDCSIFRVPETLLKEKPDAYTPSIVSIGPLHHGLKQLQPMETRKVQFLNDLLRRESGPNLNDYIQAMADLEEKARQCYPPFQFNKNEFVTMMVVDGCFILGLINMEEKALSSVKWSNLVSLDLILLENQLPYFVLEKLYQLYVGDSHGQVVDPLSYLIGRYLQHKVMPQLLLTGVPVNYPTNSQIQPKHLLELLRYFLIPSIGEKKEQETMGRITKSPLDFVGIFVRDPPVTESEKMRRFRSATELEKGGIKFEMNKNPMVTNLLQIEFNKAKGILTIPCIRLGSEAEVILRNLIAYEQYMDQDSYITEYAAVFNGLIDSVKDVEVLQRHGVLENLRDPHEVEALFNNLPNGVVAHNRCIAPIRNEVEQYYNNRWNGWKASLMLNYFNTPWAFMSVVAAVFLLVLTITQTIYVVLTYYA